MTRRSTILLLVACSRTVGSDGGREQIRAYYERELGAVAGVTCPVDIPARVGGTYTCSIAFTGGETFEVAVKQEDDRGSVTFSIVDRPVATSRLAPAIASWLREQSGKEGAVDCGSGVRRFRADGTYACTATVEGRARTVLVRLDTDGSYTWNLQ